MPRFALLALTAALAGAAYVTPAAAVVYCKSAGVPKGCVARPAAPAAVHCTRPGYPAGCLPGAGAPGTGARPGAGVGAPGVGVAPGPGAAPVNAGGPVNRIGVR
ncbi:hypothetical protein [Xanthobacter sediminis]|uniref:hypothetical protein n=1 Tax=Xanthobacter sediminis TaxID=3119926 RepID=UPI00372991F0